MELPHLGTHCAVKTCRLLDFLPLKCDACKELFCKDHIFYGRHSCPNSYGKDVQVPVCPLCKLPIPVGRNELPDVQVGKHIDNDCQSDTAKHERKIYVNKCSKRGCKRKEFVRVTCAACHQNYCLKHRSPIDHNCQQVTQAGAAALARSSTAQKTSEKTDRDSSSFSQRIFRSPSIPQQQMSEDEALARALQMSMLDSNDGQRTLPNASTNGHSPSSRDGDSEDVLLARAIAESERQYAKERAQRNDNRSNNCVIT